MNPPSRRLCVRDGEEQHAWCVDVPPDLLSHFEGHHERDHDDNELLFVRLPDVFCRVCGLTAVQYLDEGNSFYAGY